MNESETVGSNQVAEPSPVQEPAPQEPPRTHGHGRRWVIVMGVVVAVLALGGTWFLVAGGDSDSSHPEHRSSGSATSGAPASDALADQLIEAFTLTKGEAQCVLARARDHMSDDRIGQLIAKPEPGADSASLDKVGSQAILDKTITGCSLSEATGTKPAAANKGGPSTYGDDPDLDRLWDQCSKDGTAVCDELFNKAPEGSEYEAFGDTCGGRGTPQVSCAPDALAQAGTIPDSQVGPSQKRGDNPELDRLWDKCEQGDTQACLTLAFQAPAGSEYAQFGATCGNRPDDTRCKQPG